MVLELNEFVVQLSCLVDDDEARHVDCENTSRVVLFYSVREAIREAIRGPVDYRHVLVNCSCFDEDEFKRAWRRNALRQSHCGLNLTR